eukprot:403335083
MFTTNNPNNRFGTSIMDNQSLIKQNLFEQNLKQSFDKLQKRSENITCYYNQQFQDEYQPNYQANILMQNNSSFERMNEKSQRIHITGGYDPQSSRVNELQKSISRIRDRSNEIFINDEVQLETSRGKLQNHKLRVSLGVFGDFNVSTLPQVQTAQSGSTYQKRLVFRTMDKNHEGTNTFNYNSAYTNSRAQTGALNNNNHISQLNKQRGRSITTTQSNKIVPSINQSRGNLSIHAPNLESTRISIRNGEVSMRSRQNFQNKDFLTEEEKKFGDQSGLESINKSFSKLSQLHDRNWSQRDIKKTVYASPNNFHGVYDKNLNSQFNSILGSKKFQNEFSANDTPYSSDFKMLQLNNINKLILEKKNGKDPQAQIQEQLNISQSLNQDQKQLYNQIRHKSQGRGDHQAFQNFLTDGGQKQSPKKYQANFATQMLWEAKQRDLKSTMGLQKSSFDIINMSDRTAGLNNMNSRLMNKKVNGISEFAQVTHMTAPKINKDYQKAFQQDPNIFRRSQGVLSRFANCAASHKILIPSFKKA